MILRLILVQCMNAADWLNRWHGCLVTWYTQLQNAVKERKKKTKTNERKKCNAIV